MYVHKDLIRRHAVSFSATDVEPATANAQTHLPMEPVELASSICFGNKVSLEHERVFPSASKLQACAIGEILDVRNEPKCVQTPV